MHLAYCRWVDKAGSPFRVEDEFDPRKRKLVMKSKKIMTINVSTMLLVAMLSAVVSHHATASRGAMINPTVVVTVNRKAVLDGLNERAEAEAQLRAKTEDINAEDVRWKEELNDLGTQIKAMEQGPERDKLLTGFQRKNLDYQGFRRYAETKIDIERSLLYESLYNSISTAITLMAESEGYDIVIVDDSKAPFTENPDARVSREGHILQQIAVRRIMYANPMIDITQDLIVRMNNANNAG